MYEASAFVAACLVASTAWAGPPKYVDHPFGDADFRGAPLILDVAHPSRGRTELAVLFSTSIIDKYTSHTGGMLDLNYHFTKTLGMGLSFGYLDGSLTTIVTDPEGVIGNKMSQCIPKNNCTAARINPNVPDYNQITGLLDVTALWTPLYGKINLVSELDVTTEIYALVGAGINGTRQVIAQPYANPTTNTDYKLVGGNFGDGGLFNNMKVNGTFGFGLRLIFLNWLDLRAEVRGVLFGEKFAFNQPKNMTQQSYVSAFWLAQVGLGFIL